MFLPQKGKAVQPEKAARLVLSYSIGLFRLQNTEKILQ